MTQFDGDAVSCRLAFHTGQAGVSSCFYNRGDGLCSGCGPSNEQGGSCRNSCLRGPATCAADPARTIFLGGPGTSACHEFDADQASCEQSFHFDSNYIESSCWYDSNAGECRGCGQNNEQNGECSNTCRVGPPACASDTSRTLFAGDPNSQACHTFDGDQLACLSAFHRGQCGVASCWFDGFSCQGCGPNNLLNANCFNTCAAE